MKRREFLQSAAAASCLSTTSAVVAHGASTSGAQEYYEWRTYRLDNADQQRLVDDYLQSAAVPAWKRIGVGPVGAWTEIGDGAAPSIHVLLTYPTIEDFAHARTKLEADDGYQSAAADYLSVAKETPAFTRIESSLMVAFAGMPQLAAPTGSPKAYELRIYESHTEAKARRKIEMFNNGEIPIFGEAGFQQVFFGETLIGPRVPNLKYMLAADDMTANRASWKNFISHPDWVAMKDLPQYADTVSHITNIFLTPTDYSEV